MEGNLEVERLTTWANVLVAMREFGKGHTNPKEVFNLFMERTPGEFLKLVLGRKYAAALSYPGIERDMQTSLSLSLDLPFSFKDVAVPAAKKVKDKKPDNAIYWDEAMIAPGGIIPAGLAGNAFAEQLRGMHRFNPVAHEQVIAPPILAEDGDEAPEEEERGVEW